MCGIVAIFAAPGAAQRQVLAKGVQALHHRGPDQHGIHINGDASAGLGHARLALVDLSPAGAQPLLAADGRLAGVVNGEFYGHEAIRHELSLRGHTLRSASDSEIILPLFQELGVAALTRLRGEFAFVLWDEANRTVVAARDRFGVKPLFFAVHQGALLLASEVKALFAMGLPAAWDESSVHDYHQTWILPPQRTLYRGVMQIPAGHVLIATGDGGRLQPTVRPYWDFDYPRTTATTTLRTVESEAPLLRAKLEECVRLRLTADVPVACYLSGGLDSCAVLGMAARLSSHPLHAFTVAFADHQAFDESVAARESAAAVGAIHHEVRIGAADLAEHFDAALWHAELPFVNANGIAKFLLSRAVRAAGFKAVLTGEGADEIFAGYVHFRRDVLLDRQPPHLEVELTRLAALNPVSRPMMLATGSSSSMAGVEKLLGFVPSFLAAHAQGTERALGLLNAEFRRTHSGRDAWQTWLHHIDAPRQLWGRNRLNQALYLWSKTMLPLYLLPILGDRLEMAHSIEGRLPFLDHELVEYAVGLPVDLKIGMNLEEKLLLRAAARPYLTARVQQTSKHPFLAPPLAAAPTSPLYTRLRDTVHSAQFRASPFYDQRSVAALVDQLPQMSTEQQAQADVLLMNILSFTALAAKFSLAV